MLPDIVVQAVGFSSQVHLHTWDTADAADRQTVFKSLLGFDVTMKVMLTLKPYAPMPIATESPWIRALGTAC